MTQNEQKPMQFESLSLQRLGFRNIKDKYLMVIVINCFSAIFYSKKSYLSVKHVLIKNSYFFSGSKNSRNFLSTYKDAQFSSSLIIQPQATWQLHTNTQFVVIWIPNNNTAHAVFTFFFFFFISLEINTGSSATQEETAGLFGLGKYAGVCPHTLNYNIRLSLLKLQLLFYN